MFGRRPNSPPWSASPLPGCRPENMHLENCTKGHSPRFLVQVPHPFPTPFHRDSTLLACLTYTTTPASGGFWADPHPPAAQQDHCLRFLYGIFFHLEMAAATLLWLCLGPTGQNSPAHAPLAGLNWSTPGRPGQHSGNGTRDEQSLSPGATKFYPRSELLSHSHFLRYNEVE